MNRTRKWAVLFDLDGVVLDTEKAYDGFWEEEGKRYRPDIQAFHRKVKGFTLQKIVAEFLENDPQKEQSILRRLDALESRMDYPYIPGILDFIEDLKSRGVPIALVTSSNEKKMEYVYHARPELAAYFQVKITADKITCSKPDPECYLLGAEALGVKPEFCFVFEDSFAGLEAGERAGMKVIGLATTNPREEMERRTNRVISDFVGFAYEKMIE